MTSREMNYKLLLREFEKRKIDAIEAQKKRQQMIYTSIPDIETIDTNLTQIGIRLVRHMATGMDEEALVAFRKRSAELLQTKKMRLVENGYPEDFLDVHYKCPTCQDTGFVGSKPCKCFKQELIQIAYHQSNLQNILPKENFNTFSLDYYSKEVDPKRNTSPYRRMQRIYEYCVRFVELFETKKENILFSGPTGLGKTFLCNCIAKELLDRGYNVLYLTAPELFRLFEESRFHREDMEEDSKNFLETLLTVDLFIIDDLGTESGNSFTGPDLFHVLNSRLLNNLPTIISTNLQTNELQAYYSERLVSRLFGHYTKFYFFGTDIRRLKKYATF